MMILNHQKAADRCSLISVAGEAYTPYGTVTAEGDVTQLLQWSSEYADPELGLVYYNYRYYNPTDGRWNRRDPWKNNLLYLFSYVKNQPVYNIDIFGLMKEINIDYYFINKKKDINNFLSELINDKPDFVCYINNPKDFNPNKLCGCSCIKRLRIFAHGSFFKHNKLSLIYINNTNESLELHEDDQGFHREISNIINDANIKFCKNAEIEFIVCYIGNVKEIETRIKENYKDVNFEIITHTRSVFPNGIENYVGTGIHKLITGFLDLFY